MAVQALPCSQVFGWGTESGAETQLAHCSKVITPGGKKSSTWSAQKTCILAICPQRGAFFLSHTIFFVVQQEPSQCTAFFMESGKNHKVSEVSPDEETMSVKWAVYDHKPEASFPGPVVAPFWEGSNFSSLCPEQYWGGTEAKRSGEALSRIRRLSEERRNWESKSTWELVNGKLIKNVDWSLFPSEYDVNPEDSVTAMGRNGKSCIGRGSEVRLPKFTEVRFLPSRGIGTQGGRKKKIYTFVFSLWPEKWEPPIY